MTVLEVFKLTWIDLQKLIWMNFKATFFTLPVKMHTFFWILIFFSVLSCLSWLTNWVFSITAEKVTQNWSLSLLISQPLLFNKYFYCKTGIYPPDRVSDNSAMRYITFLYNKWFKRNWAKSVELLFTGRIFSGPSVRLEIQSLYLKTVDTAHWPKFQIDPKRKNMSLWIPYACH